MANKYMEKLNFTREDHNFLKNLMDNIQFVKNV